MSVSLSLDGKFVKTEAWLTKLKEQEYLDVLKDCGQRGVEALSDATPVDTGLTSQSWTYNIEKGAGVGRIVWSNTHVVNGVNIAVILQYGHGTGTGGYVQGRDYINPAMKPIFDEIEQRVLKVVNSV